MSHLSSQLAGRIRSSFGHWCRSRVDECVHCYQCASPVRPWDSHCPNCGQVDPSRMSASAAAYVVLTFLILAFTLSSLVFPG